MNFSMWGILDPKRMETIDLDLGSTKQTRRFNYSIDVAIKIFLCCHMLLIKCLLLIVVKKASCSITSKLFYF